MIKYRNKKTGAVVELNGTLNGKNWEEVEEKSKTMPKKSSSAKAKLVAKEADKAE